MGGYDLTEPSPVSTVMAPSPFPVGPTSPMCCNSSAGEWADVKPFSIVLYYFRIRFSGLKRTLALVSYTYDGTLGEHDQILTIPSGGNFVWISPENEPYCQVMVDVHVPRVACVCVYQVCVCVRVCVQVLLFHSWSPPFQSLPLGLT